MKIVVTGATGHIGSRLVHTLIQQGHQVVAVARPSARLAALQAAGAETAAGNLADVAFLTNALRGADAAFLMIPPNYQTPDFLAYADTTGAAIAEAVRQSGLSRAVHLSSIGANETAGTGPVVGLHRQEQRLNAIEGLRVLHLRPAYFMENLLANVSMIQYMGITGSAVRPDLSFPMVATKDIADKAAAALTSDFAAGAVQYILGPQNQSMVDVAQAFGQAIGKPELPYVHFSYEDEKQGMMKFGLTENLADLYLEMSRNMNEGKAMANEVRDASSTSPTTLAEFSQTVFAPAYKAATAG